MSKYKPEIGDTVFWEDVNGKLERSRIVDIDGHDVLLQEEEYGWIRIPSFLTPPLLKEKLENAKKTIHEIELTNDRTRRLEWREAKKVVEWLEIFFKK